MSDKNFGAIARATVDAAARAAARQEAMPDVPPGEKHALQEYRDFVAKAAESGDMIYNRNQDHAGVIIERLFRKSADRVDILTGSLDSSVYGSKSVVDAAVEFLRRPGTRLTILHEKDIPPNHPLLAALTKLGLAGERVTVRSVPTGVASDYPFHFAVGDQQHFRFESDKQKFEAVAQFNNERGGQSLTTELEKLVGRISK